MGLNSFFGKLYPIIKLRKVPIFASLIFHGFLLLSCELVNFYVVSRLCRLVALVSQASMIGYSKQNILTVIIEGTPSNN